MIKDECMCLNCGKFINCSDYPREECTEYVPIQIDHDIKTSLCPVCGKIIYSYWDFVSLCQTCATKQQKRRRRAQFFGLEDEYGVKREKSVLLCIILWSIFLFIILSFLF